MNKCFTMFIAIILILSSIEVFASLTGEYTSELAGVGGLGAFTATYDADNVLLTIEVLSLNVTTDSADVRIFVIDSDTGNYLLLKKVSVEVGSIVKIPLSMSTVAGYDKLVIELADNPKLGSGSLNEFGAMPGNNGER